jgi:hypothetical protein
MVRDLADLPLLMMSAPCPHCEQMSTRGSNPAVAPTWPQFGQTIRVSMSDSYRRSWRDCKHEVSAPDDRPTRDGDLTHAKA